MLISNYRLIEKDSVLSLGSWPDINHGMFCRSFGSLKSNQPDTVKKLMTILKIARADYAVKMLPIHKTDIIMVRDKEPNIVPAIKGDALVHFRDQLTGRVPVLVATSADCFTVLITNINSTFIAIVHCSYKTTCDGIIEKVLKLILKKSKSELLRIGILPGICRECFKLNKEVFPDFLTPNFQNGFFDLRSEIIDRLSKFNSSIKDIVYSSICSKEDNRIYSHRQGDKERTASFISYPFL